MIEIGGIYWNLNICSLWTKKYFTKLCRTVYAGRLNLKEDVIWERLQVELKKAGKLKRAPLVTK